jgi:hypothetical protein
MDVKASFTIYDTYESVLERLWDIVVHFPRSALHDVIFWVGFQF